MEADISMEAIVSSYLPFLYFVVLISGALNVYLLLRVFVLLQEIRNLLSKKDNKDE